MRRVGWSSQTGSSWGCGSSPAPPTWRHLFAPHLALCVQAAKYVVIEVAKTKYYNCFILFIKYFDCIDID